MTEEEKSIQEELTLLVLLADRLIKSAKEAESSKSDCADLAKQADLLSLKLRSAVRLTTTTTTSDDHHRPVVSLRAPRPPRSGVLRQVFAITTSTDFRKVSSLLESSIADVSWLLSILDSAEGGGSLSLPPIASNDPILAMLWSSIASVQMGRLLRDRLDAANNLASLARDNDRNKKMIVEEGGVVPLLKLLKEGASPDAQMAASTALFYLVNDKDGVRSIACELAVPLIVKVLADSPIRVQVLVANLVAKMAEIDPEVQEEFGRQNATRPLVTLLSMDTVLDDPKLLQSTVGDGTIRRTRMGRLSYPELKLALKINCAKALWKLSRGSLLNSRKITETKGLLCLAKIIDKERGELQSNCLMTVMELVAVAESNSDLRRAAFKPNSPAAKAVLEQLLIVVNEETSPGLLIPAIKSVGSLARTFPAKESRIIGPLVTQLGHRNADVATEAAIALCKFVSPDNFNCVEHSKAIVDFNGVPRLMNLLRANGRDQVHELVLLCYLALHVGNSKALEQARVLNVLEGAARSVVAQHPDLRELFVKAVNHLSLLGWSSYP
ncbi:hypothetical protein HYC85_029222 [Camellia sinensis]|uniref:DUF7792 domain-containing protein n=1 Tax=Camellia sinensis TaxID=4442 RepID=A0A7J7FYL5_CAMSI|nr:hypothetical protein HYC85_029222 [Camellia sinensis]